MWGLSLAACVAVAFLLLQLYQQSTEAQVGRAEAVVARACDLIKDRYGFYSIGWSGPPQGTAGWLSEFRVWNRARNADEIRANFDHSFETKPAGLIYNAPGAGPWGKLQSGAKIRKTSDYPPIEDYA